MKRDWEAYRFDPIVAKVAANLGFDAIDVVKVRGRHLDAWRKVVAIADDGDIENLLERRIEKDLLDLMNGALPLSTREVLLEHVRGWRPEELGALMLAIRSSGLVKASATDLLVAAVRAVSPADESA